MYISMESFKCVACGNSFKPTFYKPNYIKHLNTLKHKRNQKELDENYIKQIEDEKKIVIEYQNLYQDTMDTKDKLEKETREKDLIICKLSLDIDNLKKKIKELDELRESAIIYHVKKDKTTNDEMNSLMTKFIELYDLTRHSPQTTTQLSDLVYKIYYHCQDGYKEKINKNK